MISRLKKHPELLDNLTEHRQVAALAQALKITVVPITIELLKRGAEISSQQRLLTNDSLMLAVMEKTGTSYLATNDDDFDSIPGVVVYKPTRT